MSLMKVVVGIKAPKHLSTCSWEYSQLHLSHSWEFLKFFVPDLGALYGRGRGLGGQDRLRRLEPYGILGVTGVTAHHHHQLELEKTGRGASSLTGA
jgi:hypothetical protein